MDNNTMLGKIVILLCSMTQGLGMILDLLEKMKSDQGKAWRENLAKFLRKEPSYWTSFRIPINRSFNPRFFLGKYWEIIEEETDRRSVNLTGIDFNMIELKTMLLGDESSIRGEVNMTRLKTLDLVRLDADIFFTLWENKSLIPESWKEKVNENIRYISFEGTVFRDSDGCRWVLLLFWRNGQWNWCLDWLEHDWTYYKLSAVLAP